MAITVHTVPLTPIATLPDPRGDLSPLALSQAGENGFPVVAGTRQGRDRGILMGLVLALGLGAWTFASLSQRTPPGRAEVETPLPSPQATPSPTGAVPLPAAPPAPVNAAAGPVPSGVAAGGPAAGTVPAPGNFPAVVFDTTGLPGELPAAARAGGPAPGGAGGAQQQLNLTESEAFAFRVGNSAVDTASASRLADPANTVTQGTMIPAVLETAIDSDLPGYVRAVVSQDVRGFDGRKILIPRSSRLIGQYKSGLAAGQTRAYVMWTRLLRPDGVTIALGSPSVEYDGKSGLAGRVETHFFKRFGGASLLSVLGGLGAVTSGAAGILISSGSSGAAAAAAQRDSQIPPTVRVPQGQPIRVFTARDLDFSTVSP
ncbi:TrbI/VirB10 family protein [Novosphingobium sp.]|uniref:TrbI/VirB10 family protein n=1 Tax=Novosphingobium sp. TaxID=1874826 RepID=UPI00263922EC|nr:TrbI/VirB10 family protein [Novosphingobium sp.]